MKQIMIMLILIASIGCIAQEVNQILFTYDDFEEEIISYKPQQRSNVSLKDFNYGVMILNETQNGVNNNPENFNVADYFNILSAFLTLNESLENIKIAFAKFKDVEGSCEYFLSMASSVQKYKKYDIIRDDYNKQLAICKSIPVVETELNISEYSNRNGLNLQLVQTINSIYINDQKYRGNNSEDQIVKLRILDRQNQIAIDSLYNIHKTYIGKKLVGKKFEAVMWAVIQHSNTEMMERYLPIIQKAVEDKELEIVPFKMLIDRFYGLKFGYQIFGSQGGFNFDLADQKTRELVKKKYGIK
jgi:hypothetical protein